MVPERPRAAGAPGRVARWGPRAGSWMMDPGGRETNPEPKAGVVPLGVGDREGWASLQVFPRLPLPLIHCLG